MSGKRISREKLTIKKMIDLYQAKCPQASAEPEHYEALFVYAQKRLDKCVFGEEKPACKQCPVHCYHETDYALGRAENAVASSDLNRASSHR